MDVPGVSCTITAYCDIAPSEDEKKVETAILNVLDNVTFERKTDSLKATSKNLESLGIIYETIQSKRTQRIYKKHLNRNLMDDSTWFYLNKQAAFVKVPALCDESGESPLGPIKVIIKSKNIERVIEWLISN